MEREPTLCLVKDHWAYFTTQQLKQQTGDDWNDAPYAGNAGEPYDPCWHNGPGGRAKYPSGCNCSICAKEWNADGTPKWRVIKVAWDGPFTTPADCEHGNVSVDYINMHLLPWLYNDEGRLDIMAGVTLDDFRKQVVAAGGQVYMTAEWAGAEHALLRARVEELEHRAKRYAARLLLQVVEDMGESPASLLAEQGDGSASTKP